MTVEEIIQNLSKDKPFELDLIDKTHMQIEFTPSDEYVINFYDHNHIIDSKVFSHLEDFTLFLKEIHDKNSF
jgi:hypothetical protein